MDRAALSATFRYSIKSAAARIRIVAVVVVSAVVEVVVVMRVGGRRRQRSWQPRDGRGVCLLRVKYSTLDAPACGWTGRSRLWSRTRDGCVRAGILLRVGGCVGKERARRPQRERMRETG